MNEDAELSAESENLGIGVGSWKKLEKVWSSIKAQSEIIHHIYFKVKIASRVSHFPGLCYSWDTDSRVQAR